MWQSNKMRPHLLGALFFQNKEPFFSYGLFSPGFPARQRAKEVGKRASQ
jgi:hypothetical protein